MPSVRPHLELYSFITSHKGSYGPLPDEILDMYPNATIIKRNGEVDAWDNPDFREAIKATGRKQVILAGIVTDVCTLTMTTRTTVPRNAAGC